MWFRSGLHLKQISLVRCASECVAGLRCASAITQTGSFGSMGLDLSPHLDAISLTVYNAVFKYY